MGRAGLKRRQDNLSNVIKQERVNKWGLKKNEAYILEIIFLPLYLREKKI